MYLTLSPCQNCTIAIINSGIKKVFYKEKYRDNTGILMLVESGIEVVCLDE